MVRPLKKTQYRVNFTKRNFKYVVTAAADPLEADFTARVCRNNHFRFLGTKATHKIIIISALYGTDIVHKSDRAWT